MFMWASVEVAHRPDVHAPASVHAICCIHQVQQTEVSEVSLSVCVSLQGSALCAENAATAERLIVEGQAQYKPLALATTYAADKKTQVGHHCS